VGLGTLPEAHATGEGMEDEGAIFAEINITPLTDVVLVLLIIVMIYAGDQVTRLQQRQIENARAQSSGLKVNLPEGAAKEIEVGATSLVVGILQTGEVYVNGQRVEAEELQQIFQAEFAKSADTQVVIKADGNAAHKRVVGVMEQAKRVGLRRIAIATSGAGSAGP
jgi:biopolymer transport protein ExbD